MDITKWLEDTASADRPAHPVYTHASTKPAINPAGAHHATDPTTRRARRRKKPGADSSILAPDDTPPDILSPKHVGRQGPRKKVKSLVSHTEFLDPSSEYADPPEDIDPYRRRKRHKTRPDRYELKEKRPRHTKVKSNRERKEKRTTKSAKEQKRRTKDTAAPIVRNFQATNVQGERLTVCMTVCLNSCFLAYGKSSYLRRI